MDETRKPLRNKTTRTELRKTVKKKRRTRSRRKRKEHIEKILTSGKGPRAALKSNHKKIIGELRTEDNEKAVDREDILKVCAQFYQELYTSKAQCTYLAQQTEENEEVPMFLKEEIEFALRKMKPNKAPGIDQLTSDIIKLGGEEAIHQTQKIFNI